MTTRPDKLAASNGCAAAGAAGEASTPGSLPRPRLGRWLVEVACGTETITGYPAGWVARVDNEPVGFVRSSPRQARRDLLAFALRATGGSGAEGDNAPPRFA